MNELVSRRFWKALLIGGPMAAGMLFSVVAFFGMYWNEDKYQSWEVWSAFGAYVFFLLATIWATGFWGRWLPSILFVLLPAIVVADYALNPVAPFGAFAIALAFLIGESLFKERRQNA